MLFFANSSLFVFLVLALVQGASIEFQSKQIEMQKRDAEPVISSKQDPALISAYSNNEQYLAPEVQPAGIESFDSSNNAIKKIGDGLLGLVNGGGENSGKSNNGTDTAGNRVVEKVKKVFKNGELEINSPEAVEAAERFVESENGKTRPEYFDRLFGDGGSPEDDCDDDEGDEEDDDCDDGSDEEEDDDCDGEESTPWYRFREGEESDLSPEEQKNRLRQGEENWDQNHIVSKADSDDNVDHPYEHEHTAEGEYLENSESAPYSKEKLFHGIEWKETGDCDDQESMGCNIKRTPLSVSVVSLVLVAAQIFF